MILPILIFFPLAAPGSPLSISDLPSCEQIFQELDNGPKNLNRHVDIIGSYADTLFFLREMPISTERTETAVDYTRPENLRRISKEVDALLSIFREQTEAPDRKRQMVRLVAVLSQIQEFIRYRNRIDKKMLGGWVGQTATGYNQKFRMANKEESESVLLFLRRFDELLKKSELSIIVEDLLSLNATQRSSNLLLKSAVDSFKPRVQAYEKFIQNVEAGRRVGIFNCFLSNPEGEIWLLDPKKHHRVAGIHVIVLSQKENNSLFLKARTAFRYDLFNGVEIK